MSLFDPDHKKICQVSQDEVRAHLKPDQPINCPFGWTKLHYACCFFPRAIDTIKSIIDQDHGAVVDKGKNDLYPLHIALQNNASIEVVELLLEKDTSNKMLFWSANHEFDVIDLIYKAYKSANVNPTVAADGVSILHLACSKGCLVEVVELLLENDNTDESFHQTITRENSCELTGCNVLHLALEHFTQEVVDALIMKEVRLRCTFNHSRVILALRHCFEIRTVVVCFQYILLAKRILGSIRSKNSYCSILKATLNKILMETPLCMYESRSRRISDSTIT